MMVRRTRPIVTLRIVRAQPTPVQRAIAADFWRKMGSEPGIHGVRKQNHGGPASHISREIPERGD